MGLQFSVNFISMESTNRHSVIFKKTYIIATERFFTEKFSPLGTATNAKVKKMFPGGPRALEVCKKED